MFKGFFIDPPPHPSLIRSDFACSIHSFWGKENKLIYSVWNDKESEAVWDH